MADDKGATETEQKDTKAAADNAKKRRGFFSRIWKGIFRLHGDDFEKRLQYISKEEATVLSRMKRRSLTWRRMARNLIVFSVVLEVVAVGYAIMTSRSMDMNWQMRAFRILPMFLLPAVSAATYSAFVRLMRMCDRRDQKTLERLRAERQAKIDELKEKTNYYTTQQLIQRYDPDPAAKAAAATVLASKLGADSGLKVFVGDEEQLNTGTGKSSDVELVQSSGLRNRKQIQSKSSSTTGASPNYADQQLLGPVENDENAAFKHEQLVVNHHQSQGPDPHDGGWLARIAALLVGEDPTQSLALICGNCHMHNGLARKEDFPYITYYCPHCNALNKPKQSEDCDLISSTPASESLRKGGAVEAAPVIASLCQSDSTVTGDSSVHDVIENIASVDRTS